MKPNDDQAREPSVQKLLDRYAANVRKLCCKLEQIAAAKLRRAAAIALRRAGKRVP